VRYCFDLPGTFCRLAGIRTRRRHERRSCGDPARSRQGPGGLPRPEESNAGRRYRILIGKGESAEQAKTTVPEGTCYVLGDHRDRSNDSREFGPVPLGSILGSVAYIYYPAATWQRFGAVRD
jgi:hypothetical protein